MDAVKGSGSRSGLAAACVLLLAAAAPQAQQPRFKETVTVERVVLDARVVDERGDPVLGLQAGDFRVRVDGKRVEVESATWISGTSPYAEGLAPGAIAPAGEPIGPPGRLIVFFFQKDMERSRMVGLLRMKTKAVELLETLAATDRVAVLSFDSHLKLWVDFTADRDRLRRVIEHSVLLQRHAAVQEGPFPSLAAHFDPREGRRAASPETGLRVAAEALGHLPGAKSLVLFGWGLGRFGPTGVHMTPDYDPARRALAAARVSVFALDVTEADYHSLEVGLEQVAEDTGGFYAKTHLFPDQAMGRLSGALAGHYVLAFEKPERPRGRHSVDVGLVGKKGTVLATRFYEG
jgi:VWFA-related protein